MKIFGYTLLAIGLANFLSFAVTMSIIGGNAVQGKIADGRYYVGGRHDGRYIEVSQAVYEFSLFHTCFWFSWPAFILGAGVVREWQEEHKVTQKGFALAALGVAFVAGALPWILPNGLHDPLSFRIYCCAVIFVYSILLWLALRRHNRKK
jgi:hypothetical protein